MDVFITTVVFNNWTISGVKIGNLKSGLESCFFTLENMTETEVIQTVQTEYMNKGYVITSANLCGQETIKIDLLKRKVIEE